MPPNFKYWLVLAGYISASLGLLVLFTVWGLRRVPDSAQYTTQKTLPLYAGQPLAQTIIPRHDGLNTVLIYLKNPALANIDPVDFELKSTSGQVLRTIPLSGRNIGDGDTVRFQFPPVSPSAGITFIIQLSAPQTLPGSVPVAVGFSHMDSYPAGQSLQTGEAGDMSFQLFYFPQNKILLLGEMWANIFPKVVNFRFQVLALAVLAVVYYWTNRLCLHV